MFAEINGISMYYEKHGSGEPLIMVHCHGGTHRLFNKSVEILEKHFTVYTPDSRSHGKTTKTKKLHYNDMAEDIYAFINELGIEKPIFYGFSDGGIIGLILASKYPGLLSKMIISGASLRPDSIRSCYLSFYRIRGFFDKSAKTQIMLREPDITDEMLKKITVPTYVTCGSRDLIKLSHTEHIAKMIQNSNLEIFKGEDHSSYIRNSRKIADYIMKVCSEKE